MIQRANANGARLIEKFWSASIRVHPQEVNGYSPTGALVAIEVRGSHGCFDLSLDSTIICARQFDGYGRLAVLHPLFAQEFGKHGDDAIVGQEYIVVAHELSPRLVWRKFALELGNANDALDLGNLVGNHDILVRALRVSG